MLYLEDENQLDYYGLTECFYISQKKKQFRECIPHYQQSLAINSLQEGVWLRLGFAASEIEDWNTAASAYRRYCSLNAEASFFDNEKMFFLCRFFHCV